MRTFDILGIVAVLLGSVTSPAHADTSSFWSSWGDGRAELSSFRVSVPRYAEQRTGYDVLVFVTEDLARSTQVKVDRDLAAGEKVPVMKLNHLRRFQTGVYDYAAMRSVFSPLDGWKLGRTNFPSVTPIKTSLVVTEWCGNYFEQVRAQERDYRRTVHSYFDGEGDFSENFEANASTIFEDDLFVRVRELVRPFPSGEYRMIPSGFYNRLGVAKIAPQVARVRRSELSEPLRTAIGAIKVVLFRVESNDRVLSIWVEDIGERRVLQWEVRYPSTPEQVETAELLTSFRSSYWKEHDLASDKVRKQLKLPPVYP